MGNGLEAFARTRIHQVEDVVKYEMSFIERVGGPG
jgi:hypothetical protein